MKMKLLWNCSQNPDRGLGRAMGERSGGRGFGMSLSFTPKILYGNLGKMKSYCYKQRFCNPIRLVLIINKNMISKTNRLNCNRKI